MSPMSGPSWPNWKNRVTRLKRSKKENAGVKCLLWILQLFDLGFKQSVNTQRKSEDKDFDAFLKTNPRNPLILARLCSAYLQVNQPQDAIKAGQFAIKHGEKELSTGQLSKLNYQIGSLFLRSGQLDQALSYLSKSIKLTPHFIDAYIEIGKTLQARRDPSKALDYLEKAMLIAPHDPRPFLQAGILMKEAKDYLGSEAMLKKASSLAPEDVNIKRHLAAVIAMAIIHQNESR